MHLVMDNSQYWRNHIAQYFNSPHLPQRSHLFSVQIVFKEAYLCFAYNIYYLVHTYHSLLLILEIYSSVEGAALDTPSGFLVSDFSAHCLGVLEFTPKCGWRVDNRVGRSHKSRQESMSSHLNEMWISGLFMVIWHININLHTQPKMTSLTEVPKKNVGRIQSWEHFGTLLFF